MTISPRPPGRVLNGASMSRATLVVECVMWIDATSPYARKCCRRSFRDLKPRDPMPRTTTTLEGSSCWSCERCATSVSLKPSCCSCCRLPGPCAPRCLPAGLEPPAPPPLFGCSSCGRASRGSRACSAGAGGPPLAPPRAARSPSSRSLHAWRWPPKPPLPPPAGPAAAAPKGAAPPPPALPELCSGPAEVKGSWRPHAWRRSSGHLLCAGADCLPEEVALAHGETCT
mmetsp:Transcript_32699/g.93927  ORF Transcript_32699/g.93927 Transcript_32699/m.93927 type:complete len:228 (-) Transcript_32699:411-1094(-)